MNRACTEGRVMRVAVVQICLVGLVLVAAPRAKAETESYLLNGSVGVYEVYSDNFFLTQRGTSDVATVAVPLVSLSHGSELSYLDFAASHASAFFVENTKANDPDALDFASLLYARKLSPRLSLRVSDAFVNLSNLRALAPPPVIAPQPSPLPVSPGGGFVPPPLPAPLAQTPVAREVNEASLLVPAGRNLLNEGRVGLDWQVSRRFWLSTDYINGVNHIAGLGNQFENGGSETGSYNWGAYGFSFLGVSFQHFSGEKTVPSDAYSVFAGHSYQFRPTWNVVGTLGYVTIRPEGTPSISRGLFGFNRRDEYVWSAAVQKILPRGFVSAELRHDILQIPFAGGPVSSLAETLLSSYALDPATTLGGYLTNINYTAAQGDGHQVRLAISITRRLSDFYSANLTYQYLIVRSRFSSPSTFEAISNVLAIGIRRDFKPWVL